MSPHALDTSWKELRVLINLAYSLTFYRRIFPVQQLRLLLYIAIGVVAAYYTASIFATIFQWYIYNPSYQEQRAYKM